MKNLTQFTAKLLLIVLIVLMGSSFLPMNAMDHSSMNGADCFGVGCGSVQVFSCYLSQTFISEQFGLNNNQEGSYYIGFEEFSYNQIAPSPTSPPPKNSLV